MSQITFTHHNELRKRIQYDFSEPKLTDQSYKKMCDINNIVAQYNKTGLFQHVAISTPTYKDNTLIPTLEDSFNFVNEAHNMFFQLPPTIRKLMDNNPAKLESFISDPENADLLLKHGLIVERKTQETKLATDTQTMKPKTGENHGKSDTMSDSSS